MYYFICFAAFIVKQKSQYFPSHPVAYFLNSLQANMIYIAVRIIKVIPQ
jgi:hypothetical protein